MKTVEIYTDGACSGNPGIGGWGATMLYNGKKKSISGSSSFTTNNIMELTAAVEALSELKEPCSVDLFTDSKYLLNGMESWIKKWKSSGWVTAGKKSVKNIELWKRLDEFLSFHQVRLHWVKAHSGIEKNEEVDRLAKEAIDKLKRESS